MCFGGWVCCLCVGGGGGQGGAGIVPVKLPPDLFNFFFCI